MMCDEDREYTTRGVQHIELSHPLAAMPVKTLADLFNPSPKAASGGGRKITVILLTDDRGYPSTVMVDGHWTMHDLVHGQDAECVWAADSVAAEVNKTADKAASEK
jgi:hypothetical protein